ncbi:MAG: PepSY domain-containing protein [Pyrinomonadaceae bacterium]
MRKSFVVLLLLFFVFTVSVPSFARKSNEDIKIDEARKIALAKVDGEILDEYPLEDDSDKVFEYIFIIKRGSDKKVFEIQIKASDGKVVSVTEQDNDASENVEDADATAETDEDSNTEEVKTKLTLEQAKQLALNIQKGLVRSGDLYVEEKDVYFEFEIKDSKNNLHVLRVDANTGEVKKIKSP